MPKKKTSLGDALSAAAGARTESSSAKKSTDDAPKRGTRAALGARTSRADRAGRVNITGYFDPAVKQSIRMIQAKYPELSQQAIIAEALNLVFAKYGVPESADVT